MVQENKIHIEPVHRFAKDLYSREVTMPKGTFVVGKIHKHETLNILSKGKLSVLSVDGVSTIEAPYSYVSSVGAKRFFYAHEDSVWTCIHGTTLTNIEEIEDYFTTLKYEDVEVK